MAKKNTTPTDRTKLTERESREGLRAYAEEFGSQLDHFGYFPQFGC